jgi:hypothetical protein
MKSIIIPHLIIAFLFLSLQLSAFGQIQNQADFEDNHKQYIATIKRSISGQKLDNRGFGAGSIPLQAGMTYLVENQDMGFVTIRDGETLIRVNKSDVDLSEDDGSVAEGGFFRIVSANYQATTGGKRYSIKHELLKQIPKGRLTEPIKILIGDHLLRARAQEVNIQYGTIHGNNVRLAAPKVMMLTIVYEYDGRRLQKQVYEGDYLTLP